jgi:hypothetical protein
MVESEGLAATSHCLVPLTATPGHGKFAGQSPVTQRSASSPWGGSSEAGHTVWEWLTESTQQVSGSRNVLRASAGLTLRHGPVRFRCGNERGGHGWADPGSAGASPRDGFARKPCPVPAVQVFGQSPARAVSGQTQERMRQFPGLGAGLPLRTWFPGHRSTPGRMCCLSSAGRRGGLAERHRVRWPRLHSRHPLLLLRRWSAALCGGSGCAHDPRQALAASRGVGWGLTWATDAGPACSLVRVGR